jgi:alkanesulfonate monooxygenase SsuD/methylene tetrahydromethanopterin reductase-like flavin-dependent oxidoreductase (luciferase family)
VTYRNPAILAKTATTLDVISGGRAIFGIGAAWNDEEHAGYGVPFPPVKERMDRLDEALTIARLMFTEDRPSFDGQHYRLETAINRPRPIQAGGPRIMVGGGGEQRTLRIAAKHADMTHWFALGLDALRKKDEVLVRHCEAVGRDPAEIERTTQLPVVIGATEKDAERMMDHVPPERRANIRPVTVSQAADIIGPYVEAGFTGFTLNNTIFRTPEAIAVAGEVVRLLA